MKGWKDRWAWAGWAAALPVLAMPVGDPDLWWHLSAARWMVANRDWPRADWLSYTMEGRPWVDFEWLSERIFYTVHSAAGLSGLWALKAALLAGAGFVLLKILKDLGAAKPFAAAGLGLWSAGVLSRDDIRTELFSLVFFMILLRWVLSGKVRRNKVFWLFALWANLHAGFAYGLVLLAVAPAALAVAAAATLLNPYGPALYAVLARHALEAGGLRRYITEWGGLTLVRSGHWPAVLLLALGLWAVIHLWLREEGPGEWKPATGPEALSALFLAFAFMSLRHARVSGYLAPLAVVMICARLPKTPKRRERLGAAAALAACAAFSIWVGRPVKIFRQISHEIYQPGASAKLLERSPELEGLRLNNPWGWGGYLGWRLSPGRKVFQDGRYLFHPLLLEAASAARDPLTWQQFLDRYDSEAVLMENIPLRRSTLRRYQDGSERVFSRPFYVEYMPRERWALVHFDARSLLFLRRDALERVGWGSREYRWLRPGDEEALADAQRRGEVDVFALEAERGRHRRELEELSL